MARASQVAKAYEENIVGTAGTGKLITLKNLLGFPDGLPEMQELQEMFMTQNSLLDFAAQAVLASCSPVFADGGR